MQTLNRCLLDLEHDPNDLHVLDEIFRSAHTIKGMSATMGYAEIAELTHEMENVLDLLRKGTLKAHAEIIDTLFQCVDRLEQLVEDVANGRSGGVDVSELSKHLAAIAKGEMQPAAAKPAAPVTEEAVVNQIALNETEAQLVKTATAQGMRVYDLKIAIRPGTLLKSVRAYMVMKAFDEMGDVIKTDPVVEELEKDNFGNEFNVLLVTDLDMEKVQETILSIAEIDTVTAQICGVTPATGGEPATSAAVPEVEQQKESVTAVASAGSVPESKAVSSAPAASAADKKVKGPQLLRVDAEKLDSLLNLVGELVINKTRLQQIGLSNQLLELSEAIEQMDRVTTDLQSVVMKLRMVAVGQVFNRFPRMVRDLSHGLGKEINLIIQGEETELDKDCY